MMAPRFLDTNIFLRHLTNDDPDKAQACLDLIRSIEQGEATAWTSELVVVELVFVLSNKKTYGLSRETVRDILLPRINLPGLKITHKRLYGRVFELYTSYPIDYVDAYHIALIEARGEPELYSYDTDFDQVPGVRRLEP